jgi:hypothetical protein
MLHPISIDALGARKELGGVDQMGRAYVMDVNSCPLLGPPSGRTRVIEVDVGHKDIVHVSRRDAVAQELRLKPGERGTGAGLHQGCPLWTHHQKGSDGLRPEIETQIQRMNLEVGHNSLLKRVALGELQSFALPCQGKVGEKTIRKGCLADSGALK